MEFYKVILVVLFFSIFSAVTVNKVQAIDDCLAAACSCCTNSDGSTYCNNPPRCGGGPQVCTQICYKCGAYEQICGGWGNCHDGDCISWYSSECVIPCPPTCDANSWGGWSGCSVSCGGGTQTRTNACGTPQSQACNTQSCCTPTAPTCGAFSPPNPSTFRSTSVALSANAGTWGTGCPGNNNLVTYQVSSDNFATNLSLPANCTNTPAGNGCIAGLPAYDTTYKWRAILNNGSNSATCGPWTIITKSTPGWWQAVGGGDIYGVVVQSFVPDTVPAERRFIILN